MMFRGVPRRLRFLSGALFGSMVLLLVAQTTEDHQRALLEDLIYTGSNGECWVRNDAVTGNGNWDTCGGLPGADEVTESMLKAVNGATDEYCLTYEATVGDFEWQTCASGSVTGTGTDTHVTYWTGPGSLGGEDAFTYDAATNAAAIDGTLVLNDSAASIDALRVEGSSEPNLLVTDGSLNGVGIGTASATDRLTVQGSSSGGVTTQTYNTNASGYSSFLLFSTSTPYGEMILGGPSNADTRFGVASADQLQFIGAGTGLSAMVIGNVVNAPVVFGSNDLERLRIKGTSEVVFNDIAADFDVRMESQTQSSCFLLDASTSIISTGCDVSFPADSIETAEIEDGTIREVDLMAVDAAADEECLTYETTTGDFEWQSCSSGGGDSITVNSSAATDPDFLNGDIDWTLTGGNSITATVACTGCVDATDLAADSLTPADLNTVAAAGAPEDEYCLTYEHGTTEFAWQQCVPDGADSTAIHDNVSSEISAITAKTTLAGGDFFVIEDSAASNAKKSATLTNVTNSVLCQTSGATATFCGLREYTQNLNATPTFSSATPAVAMTTQTLAAGTYTYEYRIVFASNNVASGIGTSINLTGTVTRTVWTSQLVTTGGAAATGVSDDIAGTNAGQLVEGKSEYRDDTLPSSFAGVAAVTNPQLLIVTGVFTTSTSGNLELKIANDAGANTITVYPETTLLLTKVL